MEGFLNIYKPVLPILLNYWWIITPIVLFFILRAIWLSYVQSEFLKNLKWVLLEIKFPRETVKSPKAMEQFFTGLHAVERQPKFKDKYFKTYHVVKTFFKIKT